MTFELITAFVTVCVQAVIRIQQATPPAAILIGIICFAAILLAGQLYQALSRSDRR